MTNTVNRGCVQGLYTTGAKFAEVKEDLNKQIYDVNCRFTGVNGGLSGD